MSRLSNVIIKSISVLTENKLDSLPRLEIKSKGTGIMNQEWQIHSDGEILYRKKVEFKEALLLAINSLGYLSSEKYKYNFKNENSVEIICLNDSYMKRPVLMSLVEESGIDMIYCKGVIRSFANKRTRDINKESYLEKIKSKRITKELLYKNCDRK